MTNNLDINSMQSGQSDKYITFNDAKGAIDSYLTETLTLDFSAGNLTLSEAQVRRNTIVIATNVNVAGRRLTIPSEIKAKINIYSESSNTQTLEVRPTSTNTYFFIEPGMAREFYLVGNSAGQGVIPLNYSQNKNIQAFINGNVSTGELMWRYKFTEVLQTYGDDLPGSTVVFGVAPTANGEIITTKNGSAYARIDYTNGSTTGAWDYNGIVIYQPGDILEITAPTNLSLGSIHISLEFKTYEL